MTTAPKSLVSTQIDHMTCQSRAVIINGEEQRALGMKFTVNGDIADESGEFLRPWPPKLDNQPFFRTG